MGQHAKCSKCSFEFEGGHSHHSGYANCLCINCFSHFVLPTKSLWGAEIGETITVHRIQPNKKRKIRKKHAKQNQQTIWLIPTQISFQTKQGEERQIGDKIYFSVNYPIETVPCPNCNSLFLVMGFESNSQCPKCLEGKIICSILEY